MCEHNNSKIQKISKEFKKHTFETEGYKCPDCGAELWTQSMHDEYMQWLGTLHAGAKTKDLFSIQFFLSDKANECVSLIIHKNPGVTRCDVLRAMTMKFLDLCDFELAREKMRPYTQEKLPQGIHKESVRFNPSGYQDIMGIAEGLGMSPAKVVENAIERLSMIILDQKIKDVPPLNNVLERLNARLKAA